MSFFGADQCGSSAIAPPLSCRVVIVVVLQEPLIRHPLGPLRRTLCVVVATHFEAIDRLFSKCIACEPLEKENADAQGSEGKVPWRRGHTAISFRTAGGQESTVSPLSLSLKVNIYKKVV